MRMLLGAMAILLAGAMPAGAATWAVDYAKSHLGFQVQWSGEAFNATFKTWKADITFDPADLAHAHAVVREYCQLGDNVILQNGAIIGADGYGFARDHAAPSGAAWYKILQSGTAILGDNVEVQSNATVDRASIGETRIAAGAKIDNLVQVGHGCTVGEDTLLCAQVGLAGSTKVGKNVIFAGQAASAGHNTIGDRVIVTAQSGIGGDVAPGKIMSGSPAIDNADWLKATARFNKLPELIRDLKRSVKQ